MLIDQVESERSSGVSCFFLDIIVVDLRLWYIFSHCWFVRLSPNVMSQTSNGRDEVQMRTCSCEVFAMWVPSQCGCRLDTTMRRLVHKDVDNVEYPSILFVGMLPWYKMSCHLLFTVGSHRVAYFVYALSLCDSRYGDRGSVF